MFSLGLDTYKQLATKTDKALYFRDKEDKMDKTEDHETKLTEEELEMDDEAYLQQKLVMTKVMIR